MKKLRNCFQKLAGLVSLQAERLTHEQWFEFAAESAPSDVGMWGDIGYVCCYVLQLYFPILCVQFLNVASCSNGTWKYVRHMHNIDGGSERYRLQKEVMVFQFVQIQRTT